MGILESASPAQGRISIMWEVLIGNRQPWQGSLTHFSLSATFTFRESTQPDFQVKWLLEKRLIKCQVEDNLSLAPNSKEVITCRVLRQHKSPFPWGKKTKKQKNKKRRKNVFAILIDAQRVPCKKET